MFHFLHSHGGSGPAAGTATGTIDTAWCWHVVMLRCWGCDVVKIWEVLGEGGNKFDQTKDLSEKKFAQQDYKKKPGWCEEIKCDRICLHFIQIYYEILFIQDGFQSSVFFQPSYIPYMNLIDFPAVFAGLPIEFAPFLRMASSIASPAMLGRSYASAVQELPKLRNCGDLTLVKKPGNGQWRWLAQRVLFGAYQVSWDRSWFRWWMMKDGCLFFLRWGGDGEDAGWGWWWVKISDAI